MFHKFPLLQTSFKHFSLHTKNRNLVAKLRKIGRNSKGRGRGTRFSSPSSPRGGWARAKVGGLTTCQVLEVPRGRVGRGGGERNCDLVDCWQFDYGWRIEGCSCPGDNNQTGEKSGDNRGNHKFRPSSNVLSPPTLSISALPIPSFSPLPSSFPSFLPLRSSHQNMDPNIFTLSVLELLFDLKFHQKEREKERGKTKRIRSNYLYSSEIDFEPHENARHVYTKAFQRLSRPTRQ